MGKWYGKVGYGYTVETKPGTWELQIVERSYYGDMTRNKSSFYQGEGLNDDIELKNDISIVADPYALQNFASIRYIQIMGALWKVKSIEVQRPRLLLSIGGVYNGPTPDTSESSGEDTGS